MAAMAPETQLSGRDVMIGRLDGRVESLEGQLRALKNSVDNGFQLLHNRLNELYASDNQRKGVANLLRTIFTGGALATLAEAIRAFFTWHHHQ